MIVIFLVTISSVLDSDLRLCFRRFLGDIFSLRLLSDFAILTRKSNALSLLDDFGRIVCDLSFADGEVEVAETDSSMALVEHDPSICKTGSSFGLSTDNFLGVISGDDFEVGMGLVLKTEVSEFALGFVRRETRSAQGAFPMSPFSAMVKQRFGYLPTSNCTT